MTDNAFLLTRCADYKDEHNVMYVPMDVPEEITPLCWLPFFQMTACRLTDDLDRWNKHPLQRAMEKFVSSKSANYVNSPSVKTRRVAGKSDGVDICCLFLSGCCGHLVR